jgi:phospholipid-transporting ATPase
MEDLLNVNAENHENLMKTIMFLACCHTIIIDSKKGTYNSASPDELALVNAAKQFGFEFNDRDENDNIVVHDKRNGKDYKYQLLNVCEFNSTRKRMSCIFRDPNGQIILMCKGADSVIEERLSQESLNSHSFKMTQINVDGFA